MKTSKNIVLIGMPGAGKSTLGVLLAKALSRPFLDTDIFIQTREKKPLREIIREKGIDGFKKLEESHILSLQCREHVIATGGSAVYSEKAMQHLRSGGIPLFLELSLAQLTRRIQDMDARGIVRGPGQSLVFLFEERKPLYEKYADLRVSCNGKGHERIVGEIRALLADPGQETRG
jgi:shikimate kinase